jgi:hypothetical protein
LAISSLDNRKPEKVPGMMTKAPRKRGKKWFFCQYARQLVCPADWEEGKDTMVAHADGMKKYLPNHERGWQER